jgi:hypothetical protein
LSFERGEKKLLDKGEGERSCRLAMLHQQKKESLILCQLVHNHERSAIDVFYNCHLARVARENRLGLKNILYLF